MLKLVSPIQNRHEPHTTCEAEIDLSLSHKFIDELIAQIKHVHLEEVWRTHLEQLMAPGDVEGPAQKHVLQFYKK